MKKTLDSVLRQRSKAAIANTNAAGLPLRGEQSLIEWPTDAEIRKVADRLVRIKQMGIRSEAEGDYFKSGNQAYQMQEIIRATAELSRKRRPAKG
jgi:hypothetical protein